MFKFDTGGVGESFVGQAFTSDAGHIALIPAGLRGQVLGNVAESGATDGGEEMAVEYNTTGEISFSTPHQTVPYFGGGSGQIVEYAAAGYAEAVGLEFQCARLKAPRRDAPVGISDGGTVAVVADAAGEVGGIAAGLIATVWHHQLTGAASGREVTTRTMATQASSIQFDLSQFPAGVYVAQILADGKMVSSSKVQLVK